MPYAALLLLPVAACLFWIVIMALMSFRMQGFWAAVLLLGFAGATTFIGACHVSGTLGYETLSWLDLPVQLLAPCIIPLAWSYLQKLRNPLWQYRAAHIFWIVFPVALFTSSALLRSISDTGTVAELMRMTGTGGLAAIAGRAGTVEYYYIFSTALILRGVLLFEAVWLLIFMVSVWRKHRLRISDLSALFRGRKARLLTLQLMWCTVLLVLFGICMVTPKRFCFSAPWAVALMAVVLSIALSGFAYFALFSAKPAVSAREMRNAFRYNYNITDKGAVVEEMLGELVEDAEEEALRRIQEKIGENLHIEQFRSGEQTEESATIAGNIFSAVASSWDEDSLLSRFQSLMVNEQLFLNPRLSLQDVADRLNTNKTYISKLVNNTYNLGFPELVNTLRIDYAEQFILKNRHARQNEIAEQCGFLSASSFNNVFKKVTGMTPKVWIASQEKKQ